MRLLHCCRRRSWSSARTARKGWTLHYTVMLTAAVTLAGPAASARMPASPDNPAAPSHELSQVTEPTVSKAESKLLAEVESLRQEKPASALARLEQAVTPESSAALPFALGVLHQQSGNLQAAENAYREALARMPMFHRARYHLARLLVQLERYNDAAEQLGQLAGGNYRDKVAAWALLGYAWLNAGEPVAAEQAYRHAAVYAPRRPDVLSGLINAVMRQERYEEALALVTRALAGNPHRSDLWSMLATIHMQGGRDESALAALETACRLGSCTADMQYACADLKLQAGLHEAALDTYRHAASKRVRNGRLLQALEAFVQTRNLTEARELADLLRPRRSSMNREQRIRLLRLRAELAVQSQNNELAVELYETLLERQPTRGDVLLSMGNLLRRLGQLDRAMVYYERASRQKASRAQALLRQAQVHVERNNYRRAAAKLQRSLEIEPRSYVRRYLRQVEDAARQVAASRPGNTRPQADRPPH